MEIGLLAELVQQRLRWFENPEGERISDVLLHTQLRSLRMRARGQLKTCATELKEDLEPL